MRSLETEGCIRWQYKVPFGPERTRAEKKWVLKVTYEAASWFTKRCDSHCGYNCKDLTTSVAEMSHCLWLSCHFMEGRGGRRMPHTMQFSFQLSFLCGIFKTTVQNEDTSHYLRHDLRHISFANEKRHCFPVNDNRMLCWTVSNWATKSANWEAELSDTANNRTRNTFFQGQQLKTLLPRASKFFRRAVSGDV